MLLHAPAPNMRQLFRQHDRAFYFERPFDRWSTGIRLSAADRHIVYALRNDRPARFGNHAQVARLKVEVHSFRPARIEVQTLDEAKLKSCTSWN